VVVCCFDERRLFFGDVSKLENVGDVGERRAICVGVGDRNALLELRTGEPMSTPEMDDMGRGDSNEEAVEKVELNELIFVWPGPIRGESGRAGDRNDRDDDCSPLESLTQLASLL
jgi:hypothetical protein